MTDVVRSRFGTLRTLTPARVSLPTAGNSIATSEVLAFQQAHALARDAVHTSFDTTAFAYRLCTELPAMSESGIRSLHLHSNAANRSIYLRQPHLGRSLHEASSAQLVRGSYDLSIVIADGLSSKAVERNVIPLLNHLLPALLATGWTIAPIALVQQGRVAIGDPIGHGLGARCSLVLIGERPGLSCFASLGAYITWSPHPSRTDADRVCLSNMHESGLLPAEAGHKLLQCLGDARTHQRTGTALDAGHQTSMSLGLSGGASEPA